MSTWTSPDGTLTIRFDFEFRTSVEVSVSGQLRMKVWVEADAEIISDPPIYSLSFEIEYIATTPEVHGVSCVETFSGPEVHQESRSDLCRDLCRDMERQNVCFVWPQDSFLDRARRLR